MNMTPLYISGVTGAVATLLLLLLHPDWLHQGRAADLC
jgi:hypothetical protein